MSRISRGFESAAGGGPPGPPGPPGADGKTILNGIVAPSPTVGTVGDFYLDTVLEYLYGPKTSAISSSAGTGHVTAGYAQLNDGAGGGFYPDALIVAGTVWNTSDGVDVASGELATAKGAALAMGDSFIATGADATPGHYATGAVAWNWGNPVSLKGPVGPAGPSNGFGAMLLVGAMADTYIGGSTWARFGDINQDFGGYWENTSHTNLDGMTFKVFMSAGTYNFKCNALKTVSSGAMEILIDGVAIAAPEDLAGSLTYNYAFGTMGIIIVASGIKIITARVNGGGGAGRYINFSSLCFYRV
jgi:hypothetical protein